MKRNVKVLALVLMISALFSFGCSTSSVTQQLQQVLVTSEAVLPILAITANLPDTTTQAIMMYLQLAASATSQASAELQSGDTPAIMAAKITQIFANVTKPVLRDGTPQTVVNAVAAVAQAVQVFLENFKNTKSIPAHAKAPKFDTKQLIDIHLRAEKDLLLFKEFKR